jgi:hypothetical protein
MLLLDENILHRQQQLLRNWRVPVRQIGKELGYLGMPDEAILALLTQLRHPTFFTRDLDFYRRSLCHQRYCLVHLDVTPDEVAQYIRRFLRHPEYRTQAQRMGLVLQVGLAGIAGWRLHGGLAHTQLWSRRQ